MIYIESMHRRIFLQSQLLIHHALWKKNLFRFEKTRAAMLVDTRKELEGIYTPSQLLSFITCMYLLHHLSISPFLIICSYHTRLTPIPKSPVSLLNLFSVAFESSNEAEKRLLNEQRLQFSALVGNVAHDLKVRGPSQSNSQSNPQLNPSQNHLHQSNHLNHQYESPMLQTEH